MKPIWYAPVTVEEINRRAKQTLCDHLAIEFTEIGDNYLCAKMPVDTRTTQPMGILHGGASAALAETVGSAAANYCIDQERAVCVGLEINVNHIKSVRGGFVVAKTMPLHLGKTTQVWDIQIRTEQQLLVAVSRLTLAVLLKK